MNTSQTLSLLSVESSVLLVEVEAHRLGRDPAEVVARGALHDARLQRREPLAHRRLLVPAWSVAGKSGDSGGLWLEGHGLPEGSEALGLSSLVPRAAPSLQVRPDEPVVASYGAAKTAI